MSSSESRSVIDSIASRLFPAFRTPEMPIVPPLLGTATEYSQRNIEAVKTTLQNREAIEAIKAILGISTFAVVVLGSNALGIATEGTDLLQTSDTDILIVCDSAPNLGASTTRIDRYESIAQALAPTPDRAAEGVQAISKIFEDGGVASPHVEVLEMNDFSIIFRAAGVIFKKVEGGNRQGVEQYLNNAGIRYRLTQLVGLFTLPILSINNYPLRARLADIVRIADLQGQAGRVVWDLISRIFQEEYIQYTQSSALNDEGEAKEKGKRSERVTQARKDLSQQLSRKAPSTRKSPQFPSLRQMKRIFQVN